MKAQFQNIGPINEAELEIKNLTIIAGANNTGKTYLVYTLYGF
jgi:predicted ATPase